MTHKGGVLVAQMRSGRGKRLNEDGNTYFKQGLTLLSISSIKHSATIDRLCSGAVVLLYIASMTNDFTCIATKSRHSREAFV